MRLRDLDAEFVGRWTPKTWAAQDSVEGAQGLFFQCPTCAAGKPVEEEHGRRFVRGAHYILCWFANPRNAPRVPADADPMPGRWIFDGDTIDTISFVGPAAASVGITRGCKAHFFVRNGEAVPA